MPELENKVALVTGGGSGIGRACALRLAREGANVVVADINPANAQETAVQVQRTCQREALAVEVDISRADDVQRMVSESLAAFGQIDTAVMAAGTISADYISGESEPDISDPVANYAINMPLADWQRVLDINLTGTMLCDTAVARTMIERGKGGSIVNISSLMSRLPTAGVSAYCVSKAGIEVLTQVLAREFAAENIRINAIGPGFVDTPMSGPLKNNKELLSMVLGTVPMSRLGEADEIANTAFYLASGQASFITGQTIFATGGA